MPFLASLLGRIGFSLAGLAGLFQAYRTARIAFLIVLIDLLFVASRSAIDYLVSLLKSNISLGSSMPNELCYVLESVGLFQAVQLAVSFYFTVSLARLIIRLAGKLIS